MCVIAHVPAGLALTKEQATKMWNTNPDGGGFAYLDNQGAWKIKKFMKFSEWWQAYSGTQPNFKHRDFMVHFRIATHGTIDLSNTHPFVVDDHTIMAHNGMIGCVQDYKDGRSDTRVFVEETLPKLPKGWLDIPELRWLVEDGSNSKLLFYTNDPALSSNVYILDEKGGDWEEKIWFSNLNWKVDTVIGKGWSMYDTTYMEERYGWLPNGAPVTPLRPVSYQFANDPNRGVNKVTPIGYGIVSKREQTKLILLDLRNLEGYNKDIGDISGGWRCWGCDGSVDELDGHCDCTTMGCTDCGNLANDCDCINGWSTNLTDLLNEETFEELPQELQLRFLQVM